MRGLLVGIAVALIVTVSFTCCRQDRHPQEPGERLRIGEVLGAPSAAGFTQAYAPRRFSFPADHGPHPGFRNEWWYFTGNLTSAEGRRFGYQLTFFRSALTPRPVQRQSAWGSDEVFMAHFAVTDVDGERFRYAERFSRKTPGLAFASAPPLNLYLENWSARETRTKPWSVKLSASDADMAIDLNLVPEKGIVLNGEGGLSRKSATRGNASYYYSMPRLGTTGTMRLGGKSFRVSGLTWLDREWSTSALEKEQQGWDWFALHLEDGRDVMFYRLRRRDGTTDPFSAGTLVARDGTAQQLHLNEVRLEVLKWWRSPASGASYPAAWRMRIPARGIDVRVVPRLPDQELNLGFRYWEGAVSVLSADGKETGKGYLEMTGYSGSGGTAKRENLR